MLFFPVLLLGVVNAKGIQLQDCPASVDRNKYLQVHGDSCFEFVLYEKREFDPAHADCVSRGGTLAMPKTKELNDYLLRELRTTYKLYNNVWIGLNDKDEEAKYVWDDGTSLGSFSDWHSGNNPGHFLGIVEDCITLDPKDGYWHDFQCESHIWDLFNNHYPYICQYLVNPSTSSSPTTSSSGSKVTSSGSEMTSSGSQMTSSGSKLTSSNSKLTSSGSIVTSSGPERTSSGTKITSPDAKMTTKPHERMTTSSLRCPDFVCDLDCDLDGYKKDSNDCILCECDT